MKHNSRVVPFDRSAAYVRHRALKNMRENNPVDALELMRSAVEHSPDNREYLLDLAEMYCEMGLHEQSNRILLDMIAQKDAPAECYYGLALNQFGKNELESARQALNLYRQHAGGEYEQDVVGLATEIDFCDAMKKPLDRKLRRAAQIAERACEALRADDAERARKLFERSLALQPGQTEMRALYAMALKLLGEDAAALREADASAANPEASARTLCVAGQVYWVSGRREEGRALLRRAVALRPDGVELRLLTFALCELEMYAEAAEAARAVLRETPHDKSFLHLRAVTLHRSGVRDDQAAPFWLRILRIDPEDSVARYYHEVALRGGLDGIEPELVYEVPAEEFRRRMTVIRDSLEQGVAAAAERWRRDKAYRELLRWALNTQNESCGCAVAMVLVNVEDEAADSILREMFYCVSMPIQVKLHAALFLQLRGEDLHRFLPPGTDVRDGLLPEPDELLDHIPVGDRQLVRLAGDVLDINYGIRSLSSLAMLWYSYRRAYREGGIDPLVCIGEAAAALTWNYLLRRDVKVSPRKLSLQFRCNERRMVFYARHMAATLERNEGELKNEFEIH